MYIENASSMSGSEGASHRSAMSTPFPTEDRERFRLRERARDADVAEVVLADRELRPGVVRGDPVAHARDEEDLSPVVADPRLRRPVPVVKLLERTQPERLRGGRVAVAVGIDERDGGPLRIEVEREVVDDARAGVRQLIRLRLREPPRGELRAAVRDRRPARDRSSPPRPCSRRTSRATRTSPTRSGR